MSEECQRCKEVDEDRRSLWMACFYEMAELGLPFTKHTMINPDAHDWGNKQDFYILRVCKSCRSSWMKVIKEWFGKVELKESCGSGIFVREFGDNIEITREEWDARVKTKEEAK